MEKPLCLRLCHPSVSTTAKAVKAVKVLCLPKRILAYGKKTDYNGQRANTEAHRESKKGFGKMKGRQRK
ncbi:MAG: hypothetical protein HFI29_06295 [Lachnospiraceae bacterium]|nr:hypothetical protein [Lachnospiraceae bacterium]